MKILVLCNKFHPKSTGAEKVVWDIYSYFIDNFLGSEIEDIKFIIFDEIEKNYKKFLLKYIRIKIRNSWFLSFIEKNIKLTYFLYQKKLINRFDIIHAHNLNPLYPCTLTTIHSTAALLYNLTKEKFSTRLNKKDLIFKMIKYIEKKHFNMSTYLHILSKKNSKKILNFYNLENKEIYYIYNPVNIVNSIKLNNYKKIKKVKIGFVANRYKTKGIETLITIAKIIKHKPYNFIFYIYGPNTKELKYYLNIIRTCKLPIFYKGFKDINSIVKEINLLILPTLWDTFGLVAAECLSNGIPVIISRNAGVSEIIRNKYNGFVCSKINDYLQVLKSINENKNLIKSMSINAIKTAIKEINLKKIAKNYLDMYTKIIARKKL